MTDSNSSYRHIECPECGAVAAPNMAHADYCTRKDLVDELADSNPSSNLTADQIRSAINSLASALEILAESTEQLGTNDARAVRRLADLARKEIE